jgi:hypothetical protein
MTKAQKERIAADFVVAFINKGVIKSNKASVKAFIKIQDLLSQSQEVKEKPAVPKTTATRKAAGSRKKASS